MRTLLKMALAAVALACLVAVWWNGGSTGSEAANAVELHGAEPSGRPLEPVPSNSGDESTVASKSLEISVDGGGAIAATSPRAELATRSAATFRVLSESGDPVSDATVFWLAFAEDDWYVEPAWRASDWGPIERDVTLAQSDAEGRFAIEPPLSGVPFGSAIGVLHATHMAQVRVLGQNEVELEAFDFVLEAHSEVAVRVVDDEDQPVEGATVAHYGLAPRGEVEYEQLPSAEAARRFLVEEVLSTSGGWAHVAPFPGESMLVARFGSRVSLPAKHNGTGDVTLRLVDAFEVSGSVDLPSLQPEENDERRLRVQRLGGGMWRDLAVLRGVQEGSFGPVVVPIVEAELYRVRFEGLPFIPVSSTFGVPRAGQEIRADLEVKRGVDLWFTANDPDGNPIMNAEVEVSWEESDPLPHESSMSMRATSAGWIHFMAAPQGLIRYELSAPGFAAYSSGWMHTSALVGKTSRLTLTPAAELRGTVVDAAGPVRDFQIVTWHADDERYRVTRDFTDRRDGSFVVPDLPAVPVVVVAQAPGFPASAAVPVSVEAGATKEVELRLEAPITGRGRIIDAITLEPVAQASVQPGLKGTLGRLETNGLAQPVAADGSFELRGFPRGESSVHVFAPGYALARRDAGSTDSDAVDFGDILLHRTGELTIRMSDVGDLDRAGYRAALPGADRRAPVPFSEAGEAVLTDLSPGRATIEISHERGSTRYYYVNLAQGEPWTLDCDFGGGRELTVELRADDERDREALVPGLRLYAEGADARGRLVSVLGHYSGEPIVLRGLPFSSGQLTLYSDTFQPLARTRFSMASAVETMTLNLASRELSVRVTDPDGNALSGVTVLVCDPEHPLESVRGVTGDQGYATLLGLPRRALLADLSSSTLGSQVGLPLDGNENEVVLSFDCSEALELRLQDQGTSLGGVHVEWMRSGGANVFDTQTSDLDGRVYWPRVGPGECRLRFTHPSIWDAEHLIRASSDRQSVELRRVVDAEIRTVLPGGMAVASVALELRSLDLETSVADWVRAGRVRGPLPLATDREGRLPLAGLPHGVYAWKAETEDGGIFEGSIEVGLTEPALRLVLE